MTGRVFFYKKKVNRFGRPSRLSRKKVSSLNRIGLSIDQIFLIIKKKRFSETEAIATLTMIVSQYTITVKEEPQFVGETFEQRKSRVLKSWNGLTLT